MTSLKVNPETKMKYRLGIHQTMPGYPSSQDFLFDVCSFIVRVNEKKEKAFDEKDLKFSAKTLKYIFEDRVKSEEFNERIKAIIRELVDNGTLTLSGEFFLIDPNEFGRYYITV